MIIKRPLPGPATSDPSKDRAQYEADCLAGRRFPVAGDTAMQARCHAAWTMREWMEIYARYHLTTLASGWSRRGYIRRCFRELEALAPEPLTRSDLMPWWQQLGAAGQGTANKALMDLRLLYAKMDQWGWSTGPNPAAGLKRFRNYAPRKRFVQPDELGPLLESLAEESLTFQLLFLLCLLVGCRPGEAQQMQWKDVKFWQEPDPRTGQLVWRGRWSKPVTKTDLPHVIPIPTELVTRFQELPHTSEGVFSGHPKHFRRLKPGPVSYAAVHKCWRRICARVGLADVHTHDLRRTCATYLVNRGVNLALVSKGVLNHKNLQTTGVYTQAMMEPVQEAIQNHSAFMMDQDRGAVEVPRDSSQPTAVRPVLSQPVDALPTHADRLRDQRNEAKRIDVAALAPPVRIERASFEEWPG
jgi:integrase